ncbi:Wzz/FepE/Etk N-terminal domain-containing protein, partial [Candidatus Poribacteria bacterium]
MSMNTQSPQIQIFQQEEEEAGINLKDYYAIFKRRRWVILFTFIIVLGLTFAYLSVKPDIYTAKALVKISAGSSGGGLAAALGGFLPIGPSSSVVTEIEIIKLRSIA